MFQYPLYRITLVIWTETKDYQVEVKHVSISALSDHFGHRFTLPLMIRL